MCGGWIHLSELFTLNTWDTINVWKFNSLVRTVYTKHSWHYQCVEVELQKTVAQTVYTKHLWYDQMSGSWIHLHEPFTLNNYDTCINKQLWRLNSLAQTVYTKHLWHDQCVEVEFTWHELFTLNTCDMINVWRLNSLAWTVYTKHLWHNQCVEVEFTWMNCLH